MRYLLLLAAMLAGCARQQHRRISLREWPRDGSNYTWEMFTPERMECR
jgi:hypothetical protein